MIDAVRRGTPPAPQVLNSKIPDDLATVILKCLHETPSDRYGSSRLLADDLNHIVAGRPIRSRRPGLLRRLYTWAMREERNREAGLMTLAVGIFVPLWIYAMAALAAAEGLHGNFLNELIPQTIALSATALFPLIYIGRRILEGDLRWRYACFLMSFVSVGLVLPPLFNVNIVFGSLYGKYPLGRIVAYSLLTMLYAFQLLQYAAMLWRCRRNSSAAPVPPALQTTQVNASEEG